MNIFKYPVEIGEFSHQMPVGAKILTAALQNGEPQMWAIVDKSQPVEERKFQVIGTGHEFDLSDKRFISTFQQGPFVWHLFELQ